MPTDPREAIGTCGNTSPWQPPLRPWQTGGAGAGDIPASVTRQYAWPPAAISQAGPINAIPRYTSTGTHVTLTPLVPTPTGSEHVTATPDPGTGWNGGSGSGAFVEVAGCTYPDPWIDPGSAVPPPCAAAGARRAADPEITPPPL